MALRGSALATARALAILLDRWTRRGAVGAEYAAVASERLKPTSASLAVVEELAGVGRHVLCDAVAALGTSQGRLQLHQTWYRRCQIRPVHI